MQQLRCFWLMAMISGVAHGDPLPELRVKAVAGLWLRVGGVPLSVPLVGPPELRKGLAPQEDCSFLIQADGGRLNRVWCSLAIVSGGSVTV
jgi:hypothetical protein